MKETCKECRYCGTAVIKEGGTRTKVDTWCRMKDRMAPKNPCKWWRPRAQGRGVK
jgi:hypothetical protein